MMFLNLGAEVQFAITDCVALVREVADHQVRTCFNYVPYTNKKKLKSVHFEMVINDLEKNVPVKDYFNM
jgi:hypothetical protein